MLKRLVCLFVVFVGITYSAAGFCSPDPSVHQLSVDLLTNEKKAVESLSNRIELEGFDLRSVEAKYSNTLDPDLGEKARTFFSDHNKSYPNAASREYAFIAYWQGEVIGYVRYYQDTSMTKAVVDEAYIEERFDGLKVKEKLMTSAIDYLDSNGVEQLDVVAGVISPSTYSTKDLEALLFNYYNATYQDWLEEEVEVRILTVTASEMLDPTNSSLRDEIESDDELLKLVFPRLTDDPHYKIEASESEEAILKTHQKFIWPSVKTVLLSHQPNGGIIIYLLDKKETEELLEDRSELGNLTERYPGIKVGKLDEKLVGQIYLYSSLTDVIGYEAEDWSAIAEAIKTEEKKYRQLNLSHGNIQVDPTYFDFNANAAFKEKAANDFRKVKGEWFKGIINWAQEKQFDIFKMPKVFHYKRKMFEGIFGGLFGEGSFRTYRVPDGISKRHAAAFAVGIMDLRGNSHFNREVKIYQSA